MNGIITKFNTGLNDNANNAIKMMRVPDPLLRVYGPGCGTREVSGKGQAYLACFVRKIWEQPRVCGGGRDGESDL